MYAVSETAQTRLIESAQELLWERGYAATSPKAIQRLAGAGQGSMYHHFSGKADLALAAMGRSAGQLRDSVDEVLSGTGDPYQRLCAYLTCQRDVLRGCRIGRMTADPEVMANPALREPLQATFAWLQGCLAEVIGQAQGAGTLAAHLDPVAMAATIAAVVQGGYVLARAAGSEEPFERAIAGTLALLGAVHLGESE
ncbi:MAG: TetR/AcrR family transcriptional regulator [Actinomycetota bacterium]|jgi:AcrR family transcriptional regulator|nr:TetR/AcrR family transcriptional regulator [Actinomycetota bacterium]